MILEEFKYEDTDIISDTIINFCKNNKNEVIQKFIERYINEKRFFEYIQKNFLINKINESYIIRLYNDYDEDSTIDEYDYIEPVNTTRWL